MAHNVGEKIIKNILGKHEKEHYMENDEYEDEDEE